MDVLSRDKKGIKKINRQMSFKKLLKMCIIFILYLKVGATSPWYFGKISIISDKHPLDTFVK